MSVEEDARALLEDFRELREALRELPRHSLPADFHQQVLRRAERAMLLEDAAEMDCGPSAAAFSQNGYLASSPAEMVAKVLAAADADIAEASAEKNAVAGVAANRLASATPGARPLVAQFVVSERSPAARGTGAGWLAVAASLLLLGLGWMNLRDNDTGVADVGSADSRRGGDGIAWLDDAAHHPSSQSNRGTDAPLTFNGAGMPLAATATPDGQSPAYRFGKGGSGPWGGGEPGSAIGSNAQNPPEFAQPVLGLQVLGQPGQALTDPTYGPSFADPMSSQLELKQQSANHLFAESASQQEAGEKFGASKPSQDQRTDLEFAVGQATDGLLVVCDIAAQPDDAYAALEEAFTNHRIDVVPAFRPGVWSADKSTTDHRTADHRAADDRTQSAEALEGGSLGLAAKGVESFNVTPGTRDDASDLDFADGLGTADGMSSADHGTALGDSNLRAYLVAATPTQLQNALLDMSTLPAANISVGRVNLAGRGGGKVDAERDEPRDQWRLEQRSDRKTTDERERRGQRGDAEPASVNESLGRDSRGLAAGGAKGAVQQPSDLAAREKPWVGFARPLRISPEQLAGELSSARRKFNAQESEATTNDSLVNGRPNAARQPADDKLAEARDGESKKHELQEAERSAAPTPARALFVFRVSPPAAGAVKAGGAASGVLLPAGPAKE